MNGTKIKTRKKANKKQINIDKQHEQFPYWRQPILGNFQPNFKNKEQIYI